MATARVVAAKLSPVFLATAILLLGRAHYLISVKRQGARRSRLFVWAMTALALGLWVVRG